MTNGAEADRGRTAPEPAEIPRLGWREVLLRVLRRIGRDNLPLVSAGIAFNAMFAIFPALVVLLSIYGLFASPAAVGREMGSFFAVLPTDAARLIQDQLQTIVSRTHTALGIGAAVSMGLTVWSSIQGMAALTTAMNVAYHQHEQRGYFKLIGVALIFTVGAFAGLLVLLALGIAVPLVLAALPLGSFAKILALVVRWILLWSFAAGALAVVYRYAPCREDARWKWVTWGSVLAATLWLAVSVLFTLYVEDFGSYGRTYGALGGVMVLLTWFYFGSFSVVLGAELNAEMEHQTAADTLGPIPERRRSENQRSPNPSSARRRP